METIRSKPFSAVNGFCIRNIALIAICAARARCASHRRRLHAAPGRRRLPPAPRPQRQHQRRRGGGRSLEPRRRLRQVRPRSQHARAARVPVKPREGRHVGRPGPTGQVRERPWARAGGPSRARPPAGADAPSPPSLVRRRRMRLVRRPERRLVYWQVARPGCTMGVSCTSRTSRPGCTMGGGQRKSQLA